MKKLWSLVLLSALSSTAFGADEYTYALLSEKRAEHVLPKYSVDQRKNVLTQVRTVFTDLFVHSDLKIKDFGAKANPHPALDLLEKEIASVDDREFHSRMLDIFIGVRDLHTTYRMPKPYACHSNLLPFSFKEVTLPTGERQIAVAKVVTTKAILDLIPNLPIKVGHVLVSYNGVPAYEALKPLAAKSMGANQAAFLRRQIGLLTTRSQKTGLMPPQDAVHLSLLTAKGDAYDVKVPWINRADLECLRPAAETSTTAESELTSEDEFQNELNRIYRQANGRKKPGEGMIDTAEPILKYKLVTNEHGTFGVIALESFDPEKLGIAQAIEEVKRLLEGPLKETQGLIFDVRNNGGGVISFAEGMVQLFTDKVVAPLGFRLKSSPFNLHYVSRTNQGGPILHSLLTAHSQKTAYTTPLPLTPATQINQIGQVYDKPVAMLMNSNCYSSCDLMTALMQDHEAALIVGEDANTGAGGANNRNIRDDIYKKLSGSARKDFATALPSGQDVGYSWRQAVRTTGKRRGQLLENVGVVADVIVRPTPEDLVTENSVMFTEISRRLIERGQQ